MAPRNPGDKTMSNTNTGGPAFPITEWHLNGKTHSDWRGMTLRDYFAAKAMQGFMANKSNPLHFNPDDDARYVYAIADAMLKARTE
jgi:hypothetical protein